MNCEQCSTKLEENPLSHKCSENGAEYVLCNKDYREHIQDYHGGVSQPKRTKYLKVGDN